MNSDATRTNAPGKNVKKKNLESKDANFPQADVTDS
jgi:hypothetical protein